MLVNGIPILFSLNREYILVFVSRLYFFPFFDILSHTFSLFLRVLFCLHFINPFGMSLLSSVIEFSWVGLENSRPVADSSVSSSYYLVLGAPWNFLSFLVLCYSDGDQYT